MELKIQKLLRKKLAHLDNSEHDTAARYLMLAGLKHYSLLYAGQDIHIPILEYLASKYVEELSKPPPAGHIHVSTKEPIPSAYANVTLGSRQFRLDSMAHFPFADNEGTVTEVLHSPTSDLQKLLDMGTPARKRLIIKTFEEMRFSKVGLRMSDVPEALSRLGLRVSAGLQKILERTDPANMHRYSAGQSASSEIYVERHVTLAQFSFIVKRLIYLIRQGQHPEDIIHLFDSDQQFLKAGGGGGTSDCSGDDEEWEDETKNAFSDGAAAHLNGEDSGYQERKKSPNTHSRQGAGRHAVSDQEQFLHGLKHVSSKIAPIVSYDKKRYQQVSGQQNRAALKTVAQRRVDALTSTAVPLGFKDRHYFSEPRLFHSKITPRSGELASDVLLNRHEGHQQHHHHQHQHRSGYKDYKRFADLGTGMATMEIADAFLKGDIGREILSTPESDHRSFPEDGLLDPSTAQRTATSLLGIHHSKLHANIGTPAAGGTIRAAAAGEVGDMHVSRYGASQSEYQLRQYAHNSNNAQGQSQAQYAQQQQQHQQQQQQQQQPLEHGHRSVREKRVEAGLDAAAKRMYEAPGWRSAQGGWVADFGPPHTHTLYTGPEVNYAMLGSGAEKPRHNHRNNNSSSSINNGTSGGGGGGGNGNKPQQQSSSSASSVGAVGLPEQRMSAALHSMSAETAHLQEQYHSNERRIDDMLVRTHRELSSSSTGALARSAAKSPFPRSASPTAPGSTGRPSATSTAQKQPFSSHQKQHYDDDDDSGDGDADEEGDYLYDKFSSDALRSSHHHQQQQHHTSSGAGSAWDDGSYSVDTAVAGAGAGGEGLLPDSAFGTAAAVAGSRQPHSYSAREGSTGSNGGDSNSSNSGSSDDDAYLNSMDDSISLSAAVASNK